MLASGIPNFLPYFRGEPAAAGEGYRSENLFFSLLKLSWSNSSWSALEKFNLKKFFNKLRRSGRRHEEY